MRALPLLVSLVGGCGAATCPCGPCKGTVVKVVDGDTIELSTGEKIRYLLVDTPESTSGKDDCYGKEATEFNRSQVEGREIELRYDEAGCKDRYGRLLAYVTVDGRETNKLIVERGYGCVLVEPPAGKSREIEFKEAQAIARASKSGVWGACNPVTCAK